MSLEDVKKFYQRLGTDEEFLAQIKSVKDKEECSQIVKSAGYYFTKAEFEEYTSNLLDLASDEEELMDLDERELEAIFGGASNYLIEPSRYILAYGGPWYRYPEDVIYPPSHPRPRPYPDNHA
ncbi:MAG: Nif11-like leader peptide family natural product precursor [Scytonematopsis contorta HA4267-MV1]|jgi:predicted ribosomally synthesized peptide with nif11-like leader|nr:Nif11-like leader peptide family natural product precursor [Scytonematopsis contorta HA4267-MV1]